MVVIESWTLVRTSAYFHIRLSSAAVCCSKKFWKSASTTTTIVATLVDGVPVAGNASASPLLRRLDVFALLCITTVWVWNALLTDFTWITNAVALGVNVTGDGASPGSAVCPWTTSGNAPITFFAIWTLGTENSDPGNRRQNQKNWKWQHLGLPK